MTVEDMSDSKGLSSNKSGRNTHASHLLTSRIHANMQQKLWPSPSPYQACVAQQLDQPIFPLRLGQQVLPQVLNVFVVQQAQQQQAHQLSTAQQPVLYPTQFQQVSNSSRGILGAAPGLYLTQATSLPSAFSTMTFHDSTWNMDLSTNFNSNASNLSTIFNRRLFPSVHVGDDNSIPVTNTGHRIIPSIHRPLHLNNVLVTPNIIKNLIYVRQFTRDNNCTIEFDAFGFSVKDFLTRHILLRCDSSGDLYPVIKSSTTPAAFLSTSAST
ncbi:hypothetical protein Tco_0617634 [Tanacetum coccineum]